MYFVGRSCGDARIVADVCFPSSEPGISKMVPFGGENKIIGP